MTRSNLKATSTPFTVPSPTKSTEDVDPVDISRGFVGSNPNHFVRLEWLSIDELDIDPTIQRGEETTEINKIVANFNPAALGTLTAAARETRHGSSVVKTYSLLDGQQRRKVLLIMRELERYDELLPVLVHYNLEIEEQAALFLALNFRRSVGLMAQFKARLTMKEPQALGIKEILDGLGISFGKPPRGFMAIGRADAIYGQPGGPDRLKWALQMVHDVFDEDGKGGCYDGRVIEAFALIHRAFVPEHLDQGRLVRALMSKTSLVNKLIGMGHTRQEINGGLIAYNIAEAILSIYNTSKTDGARTARRGRLVLPRGKNAAVVAPEEDDTEGTDSTEE